MRVPLSWLNDYVPLDLPAKELADKLTFSGTEIEGIEHIGSTYENFVVAEVRGVEEHPNADKLRVCRVFDGIGEVQVVCGAPNVEAGGKYPFAKIGAKVPNGGFEIKKAKLRGVESNGMLCASDELGQPGGHEGLLVLDAKWPAGTPLAQVFGPPETILDLEITPNRPDCLSLLGIAREVAAITGKKFAWPQPSPINHHPSSPAVGHQLSPIGDSLPSITVEDSTACPRYTARILRNIKIAPSPAWMQRRLELAGIRAINNIVDITNYVMLECGHPLHAFDYELLHGSKIIVRRARAGEKMATLDGIERELNPSMLVIADADRAVAVAGVMGGAGSEIRDTTTTVLLEAAAFHANGTRATARALGLSTESSYRFERGVDPATVEWASLRAAQLICELCSGDIPVAVELVADLYPQPVSDRKIKFRYDYIRERTGVPATDAEISAVLQSLELSVTKTSSDWNEVTVPTFRNDLQSEVDFVEEFARVHGLDIIPAPAPRAFVDSGDDRRSRAISELRTQLVGLGLREIYNYSLVSEPLLNLFGTDAATRVAIPNPISADQSVLRPSLIPQMVETLGKNRAHQIAQASLFEIGRAFSRSGEDDRACIGLMGPAGRSVLDRRRAVEAAEMFAWIKGVFETLAASAKIANIALAQSSLPQFEPGLGVEIRTGEKVIGSFGVVRSAIRKEWRLNDPVAVLELSANALIGSASKAATYKDVPAFPSIDRDVAMVVDEKIRHEEIVAVMKRASPAELESISLFDIFTGESIGAGRKSMAYSLIYRSPAKTLTDDEANKFHETIKAALRRDLAAEIRES